MQSTFIRRHLVLSGLALLLLACGGPESPQEVTQAFWDSVIDAQPKEAVRYSTLTDGQYYDGFGREWGGYQATWGRVVIDGDEAQIDSQFAAPPNSGLQDRAFVTHLVRREGAWKVDYTRTARNLSGGPFGELMGRLDQLGAQLSQSLQASGKSVESEIQRLARELSAHSNALGERASDEFAAYADRLQQSLRAMVESIERSLKEDDRQLPDRDRQVLTQVAADLESEQGQLEEPTVIAVVRSSERVSAAQERLAAIRSETISDYQQQWEKQAKQYAEQVRTFLERLSASVPEGGKQI